ncbi:MAG: DUF6331 family protein [Comamonas sp.]|jgi:hypothetical protein|nr:DUF6331 family protein [Comamonas sp.]
MGAKPQSIDLGNGQSIPIQLLTSWPEKMLDMDASAPGLAPLWDALETICVTGCCGIDALDLSPEQLTTARSRLDVAVIRQQLQQLQQLQALQALLSRPDPSFVSSQRLNQYLDQDAAQQLVSHLQHHLGT